MLKQSWKGPSPRASVRFSKLRKKWKSLMVWTSAFLWREDFEARREHRKLGMYVGRQERRWYYGRPRRGEAREKQAIRLVMILRPLLACIKYHQKQRGAGPSYVHSNWIVYARKDGSSTTSHDSVHSRRLIILIERQTSDNWEDIEWVVFGKVILLTFKILSYFERVSYIRLLLKKIKK